MADGIENKVIVITGASSGLGEAAARLLAQRGAKLVLGARRSDRIEALAAELGEAIALRTDVVVRADVEALVAAAVERFGRIDVMIANAGIMPNAPIEKLLVEDWDRVVDVNIKGVLYGIAAALPHFQAQKSGHFITTSSVAGHKVRRGSTVYAGTKSAVRAISEGLRQEVKPWNIRTTIISPGAVATELADSVTDPEWRASTKAGYAATSIPADSFARAVAFAIEQPEDVDINEILFRPTSQEF
ncbi:MAG: short-chain dehydrogenase/reductase [Alphaproteobacteria bacterium]|nr:short-chain dehydrogenase/reductase [Alphaproteobacteria bacterium]